MSFAQRLKNACTDRGLSHTDLAKMIGTSAAIIGRNERTPSIEVAKKIAQALEISLDYLTGDSSVLVQDKKMANRLEELQKVNPADKDRILYILDVMIKDAQSNTLQQKLA
jgi:transcriptional regulator with XRE-family HTH domain